MKTLLAICLFISLPAFASLDGVYHNKFQKNGYTCEFNADIFQNESSLRIEKWTTDCFSEDGQGPITRVNGPMSFKFLSQKEVEISSSDDVNVYDVKKGHLKENSFFLNYDFDAFAEGMILKYDITLDFSLDENNQLHYSMKYLQNGQLIFNDSGIGMKKTPGL